jgi:hypothetical protein
VDYLARKSNISPDLHSGNKTAQNHLSEGMDIKEFNFLVPRTIIRRLQVDNLSPAYPAPDFFLAAISTRGLLQA